MINYLIQALGISSDLVSSDFGLFAGTLLITICVFGITKVIFIAFNGFFGSL